MTNFHKVSKEVFEQLKEKHNLKFIGHALPDGRTTMNSKSFADKNGNIRAFSDNDGDFVEGENVYYIDENSGKL